MAIKARTPIWEEEPVASRVRANRLIQQIKQTKTPELRRKILNTAYQEATTVNQMKEYLDAVTWHWDNMGRSELLKENRATAERLAKTSIPESQMTKAMLLHRAGAMKHITSSFADNATNTPYWMKKKLESAFKKSTK